VEEVKAVMRKLQNGKAPGTDTAELVKHGWDELDEQSTKLCNHIWSTGTVTRDWQDRIIIYHFERWETLETN